MSDMHYQRQMEVLLRDAGTGSYYAGEGRWVLDVTDATRFGSLEAAGQKAREFDGLNTEVVLRYGAPECELALNPDYCI